MEVLVTWYPHGWFDYFFLYLIPGLLSTTAYTINLLLERPSPFAIALAKNLLGKDMSPVEQVKNIAMYCIVFTLATVGWPTLLYLAYKRIKEEPARREWQARSNFDCAPEYLIAKVNPVDAEQTSYVIDPLGTVPHLPFGHLNQGWVNFLSDMTDEEDEMWSFYIPRGSKTGRYQLECVKDIHGYAKVRCGKVLAEFITE